MIGPFIFLDLDGVLNGHQSHHNGYCSLDPDSVLIFNDILKRTGAKVIVSSAWRYFILRGEMTLAGLQGLLCTHGVTWGCLVDVLPADIPDGNGGADRGAAIEQWFRERFCISHQTKWIALDDLDLGYTARQMPFFRTVGTQGLKGMSSEALEAIVTTLMGAGQQEGGEQ
jgi:hypothetical protein